MKELLSVPYFPPSSQRRTSSFDSFLCWSAVNAAQLRPLVWEGFDLVLFDVFFSPCVLFAFVLDLRSTAGCEPEDVVLDLSIVEGFAADQDEGGTGPSHSKRKVVADPPTRLVTLTQLRGSRRFFKKSLTTDEMVSKSK